MAYGSASLVVAALMALAPSGYSQAPSSAEAKEAAAEQEFASRVRNIDAVLTAKATEGGSFAVRYESGARSFAKAYGHLDCGRTKPMQTDALFDSGSITKAFTYAAVLKLVETGRLKLDDRLTDLFPNVPSDKKAITVAQLLDSTSGFHDFVEPDGSVPAGDVEVIVHDYLPLSKQQLLRSAFVSPLSFAAGTKREYSNLAYQLLAAVIEQASGQSYEAYVREKILLPAGMTSTGYVLPDYRGRTFAEQCKGKLAWGDPVSKGLWKNGVSWNLLGAGGMMTTLDDLKRWTDASVSGKLFRPDFQARFRRSEFFVPSYSRCRTEVSAVAGSNVLTTAAYFHMPLRKEVLVVASTRSDHQPPQRELAAVLCPAG
jgi:CubicO group peptidase (beta-lactamase class C family)